MSDMTLDALTTFPQILLMALAACFLIQIRRPQLFVCLYCAFSITIHIGLLYWLPISVPLKTALTLAGIVALILWFSSETVSKRIIFAALESIILLAAEFVTFFMWQFISSVPLDEWNQRETRFFLMMKLSYLANFMVMLLIFALIWRRLTQRRDSAGFSFGLMLLPMAQMMLVGEICVLLYQYSREDVSVYVLSLFNLLTSVAGILSLLYSLRRLQNQYLLEQEKSQMENQLQLQERYYRQIEDSNRRVRELRHDMNNQIQTAYALVKQGDSALAESQLTTLAQTLRNTAAHRFCENHIVDAVMVEKSAACEEAQIRLDAQLKIDDTLPIDPVTLCSIFSNSMDNAIRACRTLPQEDRRIRCAAQAQQGYLTVRVENPCAQAAEKPPQRQGLGIPIMRKLAELHDGRLEVLQEDGKFILSIWLKLRPVGPGNT